MSDLALVGLKTPLSPQPPKLIQEEEESHHYVSIIHVGILTPSQPAQSSRVGGTIN